MADLPRQRPRSPLVGFSTGALARGDVARGIAIARNVNPGELDATCIELSALHADELPSVTSAVTSRAAHGFARVSVHAPIKGVTPPAAELTASLAGFDCDVVCHPDAMADQTGGQLEMWALLGERLLVENNDGRKDWGARPEHLAECFDAAPQARMCLDVSHALHAGGTALLDELVAAHGPRIAQLHVGCSCGEGTPLPLEARLLAAAGEVSAALGWDVPVIIERAADNATRDMLAAADRAVRAATRPS